MESSNTVSVTKKEARKAYFNGEVEKVLIKLQQYSQVDVAVLDELKNWFKEFQDEEKELREEFGSFIPKTKKDTTPKVEDLMKPTTPNEAVMIDKLH